ncbi:MAG: GNAT family N-acetyltransferase [Clostridioides sp.]|jgi:ribosomal protein S18 acetylase RimI-like enzyme|nr:GNAT family N-acetyltransferase [Clostridioides sp.]
MNFLRIENIDLDRVCNYIKNKFEDNQQVINMYQSKDFLKMRIRNEIECGVVSEVDDEIVGVITAITSNKKGYWAMGVLYVNAQYRNKGTGKKLVMELEKDICEKYESDFKMNIYVNEAKEITLSLLKSLEYDIEGKIRGLSEEDNVIVLGKIINI